MPSRFDPLPSRDPMQGGSSMVAKEEARRRLSLAHHALRRGQLDEAERTVNECMAVLPEDAEAPEILADVRLARGDYSGAEAGYRASLELQPGRVSAESKLARMTLRRSEEERVLSMGSAYASSGRALMGTGQGKSSRSTRLAIFSAILPGLGQILGGEVAKGVILLAIYVFAWAMLSIFGIHPPYGAPTWIALGIMTVDWIYAVVDVARTSESSEE